jgi:hypothetical protein
MVGVRDSCATEEDGNSFRPEVSPPTREKSPCPTHRALFWQPGVQNPACSEDEARAVWAETPNSASRARTQTRRPVHAATTCALDQPECIGNFPVAGTADASARPSHRGVNFGRIARRWIVSHTIWPRDLHRWTRAARCRSRNSTCQASPATANCLRPAPPTQNARCLSSHAREPRNAKPWQSTAGGGAAVSAARLQVGNTICPAGSVATCSFHAPARCRRGAVGREGTV